MAQLVKNLPAMWETWVQSLGWEDPLEKGPGYPLQYSGLENLMDWNIVPGGCNVSDTAEWLSQEDIFHSLCVSDMFCVSLTEYLDPPSV